MQFPRLSKVKRQALTDACCGVSALWLLLAAASPAPGTVAPPTAQAAGNVPTPASPATPAAAATTVRTPASAEAPVGVDSTLIFPGESHFAHVRQLTFGGQNAEAYYSADGRQLIYQSTPEGAGCDQIYRMDLDGSGRRLLSNGRGRCTC